MMLAYILTFRLASYLNSAVYREPLHSMQYPSYFSRHPDKIKEFVLTSTFLRAYKIFGNFYPLRQNTCKKRSTDLLTTPSFQNLYRKVQNKFYGFPIQPEAHHKHLPITSIVVFRVSATNFDTVRLQKVLGCYQFWCL